MILHCIQHTPPTLPKPDRLLQTSLHRLPPRCRNLPTQTCRPDADRHHEFSSANVVVLVADFLLISMLQLPRL